MEKIGKVWAFILIGVIRVYRLFLSPVIGPRCRFYPSCSVYAIEALQQKRLLRGCGLILKRIMKCHPWHDGGYDPIP
ncbi:MAG: alpha hemolysin-like protein [Gammaproteobacteria bacterium]|jgi:putative membrane protein insertion efficiency factor|nr:alpha hemolysin-like protein [Gammaproteobacteria bacterium]